MIRQFTPLELSNKVKKNVRTNKGSLYPFRFYYELSEFSTIETGDDTLKYL